MYVRVKREKLTVFLHVEPHDTVELLKAKLQELLQQPAEDLRLYKEGAALEEGKTLAELRMQNDDELAVAFRLDGGAFEPITVEHFDGGGGAAATEEVET
ncbi:polyubiquitin 9 [Micractinium conductrix]|uniref:Polyubiquitin 9 n=1 Tax=Micractinium conductrix TaxID=554055 RepID=A0A2P6VFQ4_9CHLO|nr:polyubiquitin 9 [Micractinium conductrix]|eukprot:PSC72925.1 polyubiquitin 9 [Micractinium conductrix]